MANCHDMKMDEVYSCPDCGLELKVVKTCDHGGEGEDHNCCQETDDCQIVCCGKALVKKQ
jgi:hypothetical protein